MKPHDEDEDDRATEPLTRVAVALEGLTIELRSSTTESAKCRESMAHVVTLGEERMRIADERREEERKRAEARRLEEREDRADAEAITKARDAFKNLTGVEAEKVGPALRRLSLTDPDLAKAVEDALAAADAQQESANIFAEIGKNSSTKTDAYSRMTGMAKAKVDAGEYDTVEKAFTAVVTENPDLYTAYLSEKGA
jgi:hypothetical protein